MSSGATRDRAADAARVRDSCPAPVLSVNPLMRRRAGTAPLGCATCTPIRQRCFRTWRGAVRDVAAGSALPKGSPPGLVGRDAYLALLDAWADGLRAAHSRWNAGGSPRRVGSRPAVPPCAHARAGGDLRRFGTRARGFLTWRLRHRQPPDRRTGVRPSRSPPGRPVPAHPSGDPVPCLRLWPVSSPRAGLECSPAVRSRRSWSRGDVPQRSGRPQVRCCTPAWRWCRPRT